MFAHQVGGMATGASEASCVGDFMQQYKSLLEKLAKMANGKTITAVEQGNAKTAIQLLDPDFHRLQVAKSLAKLSVDANQDVRYAKACNYRNSIVDKATAVNNLDEMEIATIKASKVILQADKVETPETETPTSTDTDGTVIAPPTSTEIEDLS